jgi:hypothetical protein
MVFAIGVILASQSRCHNPCAGSIDAPLET